MSNKIPVTLYKIKDGIDFDELCETIIHHNYVPQQINISNSEFRLELLYLKAPPKVKWKAFFEPLVQSTEDIVKEYQTQTESFVFLINKLDSDVTYCMTGGNGYFEVHEYIDSDFGISIISRLINKDQKIIKSTKEVKLSGGIYGATKFFRTSYNLYENEDFGTFYNEVKTLLDKRILSEKLGFSQEELKRDSLCIAKNSFRISKSVNFSELVNIIKGSEDIIASMHPIEINKVKKLSKSSDKVLIKELKAFLVYQLWKRYRKRQNSYYFDLCSPEFEKYLTADYYKVYRQSYSNEFFRDDHFDVLNNIDLLFEKIINLKKEIKSIKAFNKLLTDIKIQSFDENSNLLTRGTLKAHLFADLTFKQKRYFFMNNDFYLISDDFINELNESCNAFITENYHDKDLAVWDDSILDENQYNQRYFDIENCIVLDKITPENIELCDVLRWDDDNIYLYHVKKTFGNTMRDLCSQIYIAASRLKQDEMNNFEFCEKEYDLLKAKIGGEDYFNKAGEQTNTISKSEFVNMFKSKKIIFVLLVKDTATTQRSLIGQIEDFKSNIAKFSLDDLVKNMKRISAQFEVAQIE